LQDTHAGQEEIAKSVAQRHEFEMKIGHWFTHVSFLLFFFSNGDFAERPQVQPPCGLRSDTRREPKRTKSEKRLTKNLDSKVGPWSFGPRTKGCNELLDALLKLLNLFPSPQI